MGISLRREPFIQCLNRHRWLGRNLVVFLPIDDLLMQASCINIPGIKLLSFDQANAYDLADSDCWVFFEKDFDRFKEMVSQWI